ncbi:helix-turn-helix domain-containing protein [Butyrivibrio proteoclasticus]|uniref:helix-turn-helix domain-containing protein n=1 Tax=Butyrivibrio proteoclasticus TaxID=43305 RepID=UPI00047DA406|nr:helix-turn-helix transcriptional regulator [Butyrivibrio proteoclasticus]
MSNKQSLLELRKSTGLTQKAFADKFGIPFRTYQNWESYEKDNENKAGRKAPDYIKNMIATILSYEEGSNNA